MAKTKLTEELLEKICDLVKRGNYIKVACQSVGICKKTYYNWKHRGEKAQSGLFKEFYDKTRQAEAEAEIIFLEKIGRAEQNWQAAAWYLERKANDRWVKQTRVSVDADNPFEVIVIGYCIVSPDDWDEDWDDADDVEEAGSDIYTS